MYVLFLSTKVIAEIVMKDSSRKCRHDPNDLKKLERAKKRARRVTKDENQNLIAIEFRCWKGQVKYEIGNKFIDEKMIIQINKTISQMNKTIITVELSLSQTVGVLPALFDNYPIFLYVCVVLFPIGLSKLGRKQTLKLCILTKILIMAWSIA